MLTKLLQRKLHNKLKRALWFIQHTKNNRKLLTDPQGQSLKDILLDHPNLLQYNKSQFIITLQSYVLKSQYHFGYVWLTTEDFECLDIFESDFIYLRDEGVISHDKESLKNDIYYIVEKDLYNWMGSYKYLSITNTRKNLYNLITIGIALLALIISIYSTYDNKKITRLEEENRQLKLTIQNKKL